MQAELKEQIAQLSPEKRALLALKLREKRQDAGDHKMQLIREQRDTAPLSFPQQRFWFLNQLEPNLSVYNEWTAIHLTGTLDIAALEQAIETVVRRHEALRTTFVVRDDQPLQEVNQNMIVPLDIINLRALPKSERWEKALRLASAETQCPFDLDCGTLYRAKLFQLDEQAHILLQVFHHIVIDAWSATVLYLELGMLYTALSQKQHPALPDLPVQYTDFTVWQRQWLQTQEINTQLNYWKKQLANLSPLQLATDRPRSGRQTYRGAQHSHEFSADLLKSLQTLSQQAGASLFMILLAAFQTLLYRYTGQDDVVVGSPVANRSRPELEKLIGCFTNTLVLRSNLSGNPSFRMLLARVRATVLDALSHQELPFEKLVEELQPERDLSRTPIFQVMLVYNNTALNYDQFEKLQAMPVDVESTIARFDLTFSVMELDVGLKTHLIYNADLFDAATIARMAGHLETLLAGIVADPDTHLQQLPLLSTAERQQLQAWNQTQADYPHDQTIVSLFEAQVARTPDAVAVVFEDQSLTYRQLNEKANRIAHYLLSLKTQNGEILLNNNPLVAIAVQRSLEMLIGLLAILKAGGAYVPIDPDYPAARIAYMLADSTAPLLLTQGHLVKQLALTELEHEYVVLCVDEINATNQSNQNLEINIQAQDLAYIIYTSGSTGKPKGVAIGHNNATQLINWAYEVFNTEQLTGVLASTSICFDLSIFEMFVPLTQGGAVVLVKDALQLQQMVQALLPITLVNTVPSVATALLNSNAIPKSVQVINLAGEPLKNNLVQTLYKETSTQHIYNLYGPSEDTTYSTFTRVTLNNSLEPTIGRPINNTRIYILDAKQQLQPIGIAGELCIAGAGLARGYLNQPELTTEKFIEVELFGKLERIYKTGDLARWLPDGNLEYLGRIDHQVKLRGFRIELGEIETVLSRHPAVQESIVIVREDIPGDKRLLAYITANAAIQDISNTALRTYLQQHLPDYMIPAAFVLLDVLPLTPNGKVDRRALPVLATAEHLTDSIFTPPSTATEKTVADIWQQVLGIANLGIHDDFFETGGHSLLATQVINRCCVAFQVEIALLSLFEERSIARIAAHIDKIRLTQELQQTMDVTTETRDELIL